jgi:hypothetical protein
VLSLFWAPPGAGLFMWRPGRKDFAVLKVRQRIVVTYETGAFSVRLDQTAQYMCTGLVEMDVRRFVSWLRLRLVERRKGT